MDKPEWLPEIVDVDGNWSDVFKMLHDIFKRDFIEGKPKLDEKVIFWDRRVNEEMDCDAGFWHLITREDHKTGDRLVDNRRAERINWCRPMIENFSQPEIKCFEYLEYDGTTNIYLWIVDFDYVIIFKLRELKFGEVALITAFHVDGDSKRRDLNRKYEKRIS